MTFPLPYTVNKLKANLFAALANGYTGGGPNDTAGGWVLGFFMELGLFEILDSNINNTSWEDS